MKVHFLLLFPHAIFLVKKFNGIKIKKVKLNKLNQPIPFVRLIPNFLTIVGLIIGVSSIRFALDSRWEVAVYCIIISALIDGIDGRVARMLNATSPLGAELDSLCDFANFGLSPAYLIYMWSFQQYEYKVLSSFVMLLFISCMALRLARFNISIVREKIDKRSQNFFVGVPAPCGALLALTPIILDFDISTKFNLDIRSHTILIDCYIAMIALLLASRLPTLSIKNFHIKPEYLYIYMIFFAMLTINIMVYPWYALPIISFCYFCSIPIVFFIKRIDQFSKFYL